MDWSIGPVRGGHVYGPVDFSINSAYGYVQNRLYGEVVLSINSASEWIYPYHSSFYEMGFIEINGIYRECYMSLKGCTYSFLRSSHDLLP